MALIRPLAILLIALTVYCSLAESRTPLKCGSVKRYPCRNGKRREMHQYLARGKSGFHCRRRFLTVNCRSRKRECKCSAVGDPHYRTYDHQLIHFFGKCRYTLSKMKDRKDKCYFNVEVQNEHRGHNKLVTYTKFVDVHVGGRHVRLGKHRRVYVRHGHKWHIKPAGYHFRGLRVYLSGRFVQLYYSHCNLRVAFDGRSNAFIIVPKRFAGKMTGICGDCNGKKDDFRTKDGKDVTKSKNRNNLIGDSYAVNKHGRKCAITKPPPKHFCNVHWRKRINRHHYCGIIRNKKGPFARCIRSGKVNVHQMMSDCRKDLCSNAHNRHRMHRARCEILKAFEEQCEEAGIHSISWRGSQRCPLKCGTNKRFSLKVARCPKTCSSHFYGTKRLCHLIPKRSGCECKPGFVLDGEMCVRPKDCKCLEVCADRMKGKKCRKWKAQGRCKKFPRFMKTYCNRTCKNCKRRHDCRDRISTRRCHIIKRQGKCKNSFYRESCGLTCNLKKCPCGKSKVIKTGCHPRTKVRVIHVTHFRRNLHTGNCYRTQHKRTVACGHCPHWKKKHRGKCNLCKGRREFTFTFQKRNFYKHCIRRTIRRSRQCRRCPKKNRRTRHCRGESWAIGTFTQRRVGCFHCRRHATSTLVRIRCRKPHVHVGRCSRKSCTKVTRHYRYRVRHCKCRRHVRNHVRACCCRRKNKTTRYCRKGKRCVVKVTYKFAKGKCHRRRTVACVLVTCPKRRFIRGKCLRSRNCYAHDHLIRYVRLANCKCRKVLHSKARKCCCRRGAKIVRRCVGSVHVVKTITWHLNRRRGRCVRRVRVSRHPVRCPVGTNIKIGKCNAKTCRQGAVRIIRGRKGCRCTVRHARASRICCCKRGKKLRRHCSKNVIYHYHYRRELKNKGRFARVCRWSRYKVTKKRVLCNRKRIIMGVCRRLNVPVFDKVLVYFAHKCKCHVRTERGKKRSCHCSISGNREGSSKCDRKKCVQRHYRITAHIGKGKCHYKKRFWTRRCCCNRRPHSSRKCNKRTGNFVERHLRWSFNKVHRTCVAHRSHKVFPVHCHGTRRTRGKCGSHGKYFYKEVTITTHKHRSRCSCFKRRHVRVVRCKCRGPHKLKPYCHKVLGAIVHRTRYWTLTKKRTCRKHTHRHLKRIRCSRKVTRHYTSKRRVGKICLRFLVISRRVRRGCRCVVHARRHRKVCGCYYKPQHIKRCRKNSIIHIRVTHRLDKERNRCVRHATRKPKTIKCARTHKSSRTRCIKCFYRRIVSFFGVRHCRCRRVRHRVTRHRCCCPKNPRPKVFCRKHRFRVTVIRRYRLSGNKCPIQTKRIVRGIKCKKHSFHRGPCNKRTGFRIVKGVYYRVRHCRCIRVPRHKRMRCACVKAPLIKRHCNIRTGQGIARVYFWKLRKHKCLRYIRFRVKYRCRCSRSRSHRKCVNHRVWKRVFVSYRLRLSKIVHGVRVTRCEKEVKVTRHAVRCRRTVHRNLSCNYHKKRRCIRQIRHVARNCRCQRRVRLVNCKTCGCHRLNNVKVRCIARKVWTINIRYANGRKRCVPVVSKKWRRVKCGRVRRHRKACTIRRGAGVYRKVVTHVPYINSKCKCRVRTHVRLVICSCHGSSFRKDCHKNHFRRKIQSYFVKRGNGCKRMKRVTRRRVHCRKPHLVRSRCNRKHCRSQNVVARYHVRHCKCVRRLTTHINTCCCRKASHVRKCIKNKWVTIVHRHVLVRTSKRLVLKIRRNRCRTHVTRRHRSVKCRHRRRWMHCNAKTGVYIVRERSWRSDKCKCRSSVRTLFLGRCRCPKPSHHQGKCGRRYRVTTIVYYKLVGHKCKRRVRKIRRVCRCNKGSRKRLCKNGRFIHVTIRYGIAPRCQKLVRRTTHAVHCPASGVTVSRCNRAHCTQLRSVHRSILNKRTCRCIKRSHSTPRKCCCPRRKVTAWRCAGHNRRIRKIISYRLRAYRCHKHVRVQRRHVTCNYRRVYRKCNRKTGIKTVRVVIGYAHNCKCKRRSEKRTRICVCSKRPKYQTSISRRCHRNGRHYVHTVVWYVLRNGRCHRRVKHNLLRVRCSKVTHHKHTCHKKSCVETRTYFRRASVKCKCKSVAFKTVRRKCCCPKRRVIRRKCVKNRIQMTYYRSYRLVKGRCLAVHTRRGRTTACPRNIKYHKHCPKKGCNGRIYRHFHAVYKCRCVLRRKLSRHVKCCCAKNRSIKICRKGVRGHKIISYRLVRGSCLKRVKHVLHRVHCARKTCTTHFGKCRKGAGGFSRRVVVAICPRLHRCHCHKKRVGRKTIICGCPKKFKTIRGKCNRKTCKKHIIIKGLFFNAKSKHCLYRTLKHNNERCCCHKNLRRKHRCVKHTIRRTVIFTSHFNRRKRSCYRKKRVVDRHIKGCSLKPRFIRKSRHCKHRQAYGYTLRHFVVAKHCRCTKFTRRTRYTCSCTLAYPPTHSRRCINHRIMETRKYYSVRRGSRCVRRSVIRRLLVKCSRKSRVRRHCKKNKRIGVEIRYIRKPHKCRCRWARVSKRSFPCRCPRPKLSRRCHGHVMYRIRTVYRRTRYRCVPKKTIRKHITPCRKHPKVTNNRKRLCSKSLRYHIRTERFFRRGCQCRKRVHVRWCHCRCRKSHTTRRCHRFKIITRQVYFVRKGCRCLRRVRVHRRHVKCPRPIVRITRGRCVRRGKGDASYRVIIYRRHQRNHKQCTCKIVERRITKICACRRRTKHFRRCVHNNRVQHIYQAIKLVGKKCRWVTTRRRITAIRCGAPRKYRVCNKKSGVLIITHVRRFAKDCKCIRRTKTVRKRCRCDATVKRVPSERCNRKTCFRRLRYYRLVLRVGRCVRKFFYRRRRCCCKQPKHRKPHCDARRGRIVHLTVRYELLRGRCARRRRVRYRYIHCKASLRVKPRCNKVTGKRTVKIYKLKRIACGCRWRLVRVKHNRCRCPRSHLKRSCQRNRRRIVIVHRVYVLKNHHCTMRRTVKYRAVHCKRKHTSVHCNRKTGVEIVIHHHHHLNHHCKCIVRRLRHVQRCHCKLNRKVRHFCRSAKGERVTVIHETRLSKRRRCVRVKKRKVSGVLCGTRTWKRKSRCVRKGNRFYGVQTVTHFRRYRSGCQCKVRRHKKHCHCNCRRPKSFRRCHNNHYRVTKFSVHRRGCRCHLRKRVHRIAIKCGRSPPSRSKCNPQTRLRTHIRYRSYVRGCKCRQQRIVRHVICRCRKNFVHRRCVGGNRFVHRHVRYTLRRGRCYKHTKVVTKHIRCGKRVVLRRGKCNKRTRLQQYVRLVTFARHCKCVKKKYVTQKVCRCKKGFRHVRKCNAKRCVQEVRHYGYRLVGHRCKRVLNHSRFRRCCCTSRHTKRRVCRGKRLYHETRSYKFVKSSRTCKQVVRRREISIKCGRRVIHRLGKCDKKTCIVRRKSIHNRRVGCRCLRSVRVRYGKCCCAKSRTVTKCIRHRTIRTTVIVHRLKNYKCKRRVYKEHRTVKCNFKHRKVHNCNKFSKRRLIVVRYGVARHCKCVIRVRKHYKLCPSCGGGFRVKFRFCNGKLGIRVSKLIKEVPNYKTQTCTKITRTVKHSIRCPRKERVVRSGRCVIRRGRNIYKRVHFAFFRRVACRCTTVRRSRLVLCGCGSGKTTKHCKHRTGMSYLRRIDYKILVKGKLRRCVRLVKIVHRRMVKCGHHNKAYFSKCNPRTCKRHHVRRVGVRRGCRCLVRTHKRAIKCCCPKPRTVHKCRYNRRYSIHVSYRLRCRNKFRCSCHGHRRIITRLRRCPKPMVHSTKCHRNRRRVTVTYYRLHKCRCRKLRRHKHVPCKHCVDYTKDCRHLVRNGFCETSPRVRNSMCKKSCGTCHKCLKHQRYRLIHGKSMRTPTIYGGIFLHKTVKIPKRVHFKRAVLSCKHHCNKHAVCRSFELRNPNSKSAVGYYYCYINTVTPKGLKLRTYKSHGVVRRPGSVIGIKYCRHKCKKPRVVKRSRCRCKKYTNGLKLCYRTAKIVMYRHTYWGKCKRYVITRRMGCKCGCKDRIPRSKCAKARRDKKCGKSEVRKLCRRTCGKCMWTGRFKYRDVCHRSTKLRAVIVVVRYHWHHICLIRMVTKLVPCTPTPCRRLRFVKPGPCLRGRRISIRVSQYVHGNSCRRKVTKVITRCHGCCPSIERIPGNCHRGKRVVTIRWWDRIKGCCRLRVQRRVFNCAGCAKRVSTRLGPCRYKFRVQYKVYYVKMGKKCHRRSSPRLVPCLHLKHREHKP